MYVCSFTSHKKNHRLHYSGILDIISDIARLFLIIFLNEHFKFWKYALLLNFLWTESSLKVTKDHLYAKDHLTLLIKTFKFCFYGQLSSLFVMHILTELFLPFGHLIQEKFLNLTIFGLQCFSLIYLILLTINTFYSPSLPHPSSITEIGKNYLSINIHYLDKMCTNFSM